MVFQSNTPYSKIVIANKPSEQVSNFEYLGYYKLQERW